MKLQTATPLFTLSFNRCRHTRKTLLAAFFGFSSYPTNVTFSSVPRNFVPGGRGSTNSVGDREQRERGSGGGSHLVRGSAGSCNLVEEILFHVVKSS
jgi:hypothetical protein